ncbi:Isoprimeverose transporter [Ruegeria sp. THAF57]|uniref:MFS transporter n=1 Tax=Ruegeria sp. THAF57 TaxID=2744555 RepID=UPI0015DE7C15|nr:glycoside-pentoside-hexuronide (GPH):cation symporter [Ruegeria sp. THAF57]CAD0183956.1 Isoprimeverose transporter [Ruegeria sp. THAF57]
MTQTDRVSAPVLSSFALALGGQNILFVIQLNFLLMAFTDILGLMPAAVATLLLVARIFDAVNDPIMGYVAERTRTRLGKFRPWLLGAPLPLGVLTVAMFMNPQLGSEGNLVYAYAVYIAWTVFYTMTDIPIWSLTATMTRNDKERARVVAVGRVVAMLALAAAGVLVPVVAQAYAPDDKSAGYLFAVFVFACIAVPLLLLAGIGVREKVVPTTKKYSLGDQLGLLRQNRPLQLLILSSVLGCLSFVPTIASPYYAEYTLGDAGLLAPIMGTMLLGTVLGIWPTVFCAARIGKVETILISTVIRGFVGLAYFWIGFDSLPIVLLLTFVGGFLVAPIAVLIPVLIGDTVDYVVTQTGIRSEGIAFAAFTFSNKASTGLAAWAAGMILAATGYVANQAQNADAVAGIFWLVSLMPAFGAFLSIPPLLFLRPYIKDTLYGRK